MNETRIKQLLQFSKETPNDPFIKYALALEYLDAEPLTAKNLFIELLDNFEDYIPTYFHAAHLFIDLDEIEKAKRTFEKGIKLCEKEKDLKTLAELKNAYQNFLIEFD